MVHKKNPVLDAPFYYGATLNTLRFAAELRKQMTPCEILLWERLSASKIKGLTFRRQHPIGDFIADFYCHQKKLVIEIDGEVHNDPQQKDYDVDRTKELGSLGITVIRFTNNDVLNRLDEVIREIENSIEK